MLGPPKINAYECHADLVANVNISRLIHSNIVIGIDYSAYCNYQLFTINILKYGNLTMLLFTIGSRSK